LKETAYSAFGSTRPVIDIGGERVRWFCTRMISNDSVLEQVLREVVQSGKGEKISRFTVRVISEGDLSPACQFLLAGSGFKQEAKIIVGGERGLVITYIGKCLETRRSNAADVVQEKSMLAAILTRTPKGASGLLADFEQMSGFEIQRVGPDSLSAGDVDHLTCLHGKVFPTFPYDFRQKLRIMRSDPETYLMVVARSCLNGQIHAFSNLEINTLQLDDGSSLRLAEYDNSMRTPSTLSDVAVNGLGSALRLQLAMLAEQNDVDVCHAESRAGLVAINAASHNLGMRLGGALEKHLLISGECDIVYQAPSRFETMNVWYLDREALGKIRSECEAA